MSAQRFQPNAESDAWFKVDVLGMADAEPDEEDKSRRRSSGAGITRSSSIGTSAGTKLTKEGILARLDARFDGSKAPQARNTSGSQLGAAAYASPGLQPGSSAAAARSSDGSPSQPVLRRSGSNVGSGEASPAPRALHRTSSSSGTGAGSPLGLPGAGAANKPKAGAAGSSGNWLKGGGGGKANVSAALGDVLG